MVLRLSKVVVGVDLGFDPAWEFGQEDAAWFGEFLQPAFPSVGAGALILVLVGSQSGGGGTVPLKMSLCIRRLTCVRCGGLEMSSRRSCAVIKRIFGEVWFAIELGYNSTDSGILHEVSTL